MGFIDGKCPACAKAIEVPAEEEQFFCPYCGSKFLRDAAVAFNQSPSLSTGEASLADFVIIGGTLVNYTGDAASVVVPECVSCIAESAFEGRKTLQNVVIPESVTAIEAKAFRDCSSLRKVSFPKSLIRIGLEAFFGCSSLVDARFSPDLTSIGKAAFRDCSSLTQVYIPGTCKYTASATFDSEKTFDAQVKIVKI